MILHVQLKREGFDFDYISDRQIIMSDAVNGKIVTPGKSAYTTIVVPCCKRMPLSTLRQLRQFGRERRFKLFLHIECLVTFQVIMYLKTA